jgi:hypothetical protein
MIKYFINYQCGSHMLMRRLSLLLLCSARIRDGSRFKRFLCFLLINVIRFALTRGYGYPRLKATVLYNGYRRKSGRGVELTTHLELVPRPRKREPIHPLHHTSSWHSG